MDKPEVEIRFERRFLNKNARVRVTVRAGDQCFADEFKITSERSRTRFAAKVAERFAALDEPAVHDQLDRILREYVRANPHQRAEQISAALGTDSGTIRPVMKRLIEAERVRTKGQKRARTYSAT